MKHTFLAALHGLILSGCLMLASPLLAQTDPATPGTPRATIDANGVDLSTGLVNLSAASIAIGGTHGMAWTQGRGDITRSRIVSSVNSQTGQTEYAVSIGDNATVFVQSGSTFIPKEADGASLTYSSSSAVYTFTDSAGDVAVYNQVDNFFTPAGYTYIHPVSITFANGTKYGFSYFYATWRGSNTQNPIPYYAYRLASISSSTGYTLTVKYQLDTISPPQWDYPYPPSSWLTPTAIQLAPTSACTATASQVCSTPTTLPSVGFSGQTITDALGRVTTVTGTNTAPTAIQFPGSSANDISITYTSGQATSVTAAGVTTSYGYSDNGSTRTTTVTRGSLPPRVYTFNIPTLQMLSESWQATSGGPIRKRQYSYNSSYQLTQVTEPEGNYVTYTYDGRGNVTQTRMVSKTPGTPADIVTSASFDATCSNPVTCNQPNSTTDARGNTTNYTYDPTHGGVLTVTAPAVAGVRPQVRYTYAQLGPDGTASSSGVWVVTGISTCAKTASCTGTADEIRTTITYGSGLNPILVRKAAGDGSLAATTAAVYDGAGNPYSTTDALGNVTRYRYDTDRELVGVVGPDPDGSGSLKNRARRITYNASGLVSLVESGTTASQSDSDWAGFSTLQQATTTYDTNRRKVQASVQAGGTAYSVAQYSYDAVGRPDCTAVRMNPSAFSSLPASACTQGAAGSFGPDRISRNSYDGIGELLKVTTAYGVSGQQRDDVTYSYSPNGKTVSLTDARGNLTTVIYDGFDRPSQTLFPSPSATGSSNASDYEQLGYDANSNVTTRRLRDGTSITYVYDALNRQTTRYLPAASYNANPTFSYDLLGRLLSATNGNGSFTSGIYLTWDALGRKTSEQENVNNVAGGTKTFLYDAAGRRTRMTWPDGFYVTYGYDNANETTSINENGGTALAALTYDDLGRRKTRTLANGTTTTYGFDPVSRLSSLALAGGTGATTVTLSNYSPAGEIGSRSNSNDAYAWTGGVNVNRSYTTNGLNQYSQSGSVALGYDGRGNLTSSGSNSYAYTAENLLAAGGGGTFGYDGMGRLVTSSTEAIRFDYDGAALIGEYSNSGALLRRYVFGPGVDEPIVWYEGSGTTDRRYIDQDERGSVTRITRQDGSTLAIDSYDEYGVPALTNQGRFQYTGQAWLPSLGMQYSKARIYSPTLGRFMQTDPSGYSPGPNLYAYAGVNPVNASDPSGLITLQEACQNAGDRVASQGGTCERQVKGQWVDDQGAAEVFYQWQASQQTQNSDTGPTVGSAVGAGIVVLGNIGIGAAEIGSDGLDTPAVPTEEEIIVNAAVHAQEYIDGTAAEEAEAIPSVGQTIYRVYGGDSAAGGASWTPVNPGEVANFRDLAGLPSGGASGATNTGQFVITGTLTDPSAVVLSRPALPLDGNVGGLPEYIIPNGIGSGAINVTGVGGVNPPF